MACQDEDEADETGGDDEQAAYLFIVFTDGVSRRG